MRYVREMSRGKFRLKVGDAIDHFEDLGWQGKRIVNSFSHCK
jgi:hypothetical protein